MGRVETRDPVAIAYQDSVDSLKQDAEVINRWMRSRWVLDSVEQLENGERVFYFATNTQSDIFAVHVGVDDQEIRMWNAGFYDPKLEEWIQLDAGFSDRYGPQEPLWTWRVDENGEWHAQEISESGGIQASASAPELQVLDVREEMLKALVGQSLAEIAEMVDAEAVRVG